MGLGEMGVGKMGLGEMGVGEMAPITAAILNLTSVYCYEKNDAQQNQQHKNSLVVTTFIGGSSNRIHALACADTAVQYMLLHVAKEKQKYVSTTSLCEQIALWGFNAIYGLVESVSLTVFV